MDKSQVTPDPVFVYEFGGAVQRLYQLNFGGTENTGKGVDIYPIIESWKK